MLNTTESELALPEQNYRIGDSLSKNSSIVLGEDGVWTQIKCFKCGGNGNPHKNKKEFAGLKAMRLHLMRSHLEVKRPSIEGTFKLCAFRTMTRAELSALMDGRMQMIKYPFAQGKGKACRKKSQSKPVGEGMIRDKVKDDMGKEGIGK